MKARSCLPTGMRQLTDQFEQEEGQKMRKSAVMSMGLVVLGVVLSCFGLSWGQPTMLLVVRGMNDNLYKMTCDEVLCSGWVQIPGKLRDAPTVTWDGKAQEWVVVGVNQSNQIYVGTFDKNGNFNNDWQLLPGLTPSAAGVSGVGGTSIPIGSVIDWWRPDATWPVPSGFAICDGSNVNDAASPLNGKTLPNLANRFIMGVTNVNNIGMVGGSDIHSHTVDINHDHPAVNSSSAGAFTGNTGWVYGHSHAWIRMQVNPDTKKLWISWKYDGSEDIMYIWDNGINNEGEGIYPIATPGYNSAWFTEPGGGHLHNFSIESHVHSVDLPAIGVLNRSTAVVSNVPLYYGLLKIMRIK
jgi:hypothetical protein